MAILEEAIRAGEFLLSEGDGTISRETITVASGQNLKAGTVLGVITASGKYAAYADANTDGTEVAAGILYSDVDASSADKAGVAVVRMAEVDGSILTGLDANGQVDLANLLVIVRNI